MRESDPLARARGRSRRTAESDWGLPRITRRLPAEILFGSDLSVRGVEWLSFVQHSLRVFGSR